MNIREFWAFLGIIDQVSTKICVGEHKELEGTAPSVETDRGF